MSNYCARHLLLTPMSFWVQYISPRIAMTRTTIVKDCDDNFYVQSIWKGLAYQYHWLLGQMVRHYLLYVAFPCIW